MFTVVVVRTIKHDTSDTMHYEYKFRVEVRETANDFINLFARLVVLYGKDSGKTYASMMDVDEKGFNAALMALTGVGVNEWTDALATAVAETLLRETSLPIKKIAHAAGWSGRGAQSSFSRWFSKRYKCAPSKWRWRE